MQNNEKRRGLGRGLSALMADVDANSQQLQAQRRADRMIAIENIVPNPHQPRRLFTEEQLEDLANSIRAKGVIQPLIVRPHPNEAQKFEIVAGERRWRAAQLAQLHELPVLVRDFNDTEVLEVAIIENIQRADLNAIEEAAGYRQLMDKFGHTQEQMAEALGKSRSHIANLLRLLNLPDDVQRLVETGQLSAGHARALVTSDNASAMALRVVKGGLSVRETEKLAKTGLPTTEGKGAGQKGQGPEKDADTKALEGDLSAALGMKVQINHKPGGDKGQLIISYDNLEQLDELCMKLSDG